MIWQRWKSCAAVFDPESGTGHILGTVEELAGYMGRRYRIKIRTVEGEEEYPADNLEETLLRILQNIKKSNVQSRIFRLAVEH